MPDSSSKPSVIQIPLTRNYIAIVDEIDADLAQLKWSFLQSNGKDSRRIYARRNARIDGKRLTIQLHRVILARILGRELQPQELVDHIDQNGLNCSRTNLRLASHAENMRNVGLVHRNKSGYKGVSWYKRTNTWQAQINDHGTKRHIGFFKNPIDAARAYNEAALKYHGEFAWVNPLRDSE